MSDSTFPSSRTILEFHHGDIASTYEIIDGIKAVVELKVAGDTAPALRIFHDDLTDMYRLRDFLNYALPPN